MTAAPQRLRHSSIRRLCKQSCSYRPLLRLPVLSRLNPGPEYLLGRTNWQVQYKALKSTVVVERGGKRRRRRRQGDDRARQRDAERPAYVCERDEPEPHGQRRCSRLRAGGGGGGPSPKPVLARKRGKSHVKAAHTPRFFPVTGAFLAFVVIR